MTATGIWAVLPVKELDGAKQRLAPALTPAQRRELAQTMLTEVLDALAATRGLAGVALVTLDPFATAAAARLGFRVLTGQARDGHTAAVTSAARILTEEGAAGILTLPGDIPAITSNELESALAAHRPAPSFTIVPAHDEQGSNCIILSPPNAVPLRFGDNSYHPHLAAARALGIEPTILRLPGIGMDIDHPADLTALMAMPGAAAMKTKMAIKRFLF
jgi:2-phospho-L-lactate guanylyltransferase